MSNTKGRVAVLDTGYESFTYEEELLSGNGYQFDIWPGEKGDILGKLDFARNAVGLFVRWTEVDEEFLSQIPTLSSIVRYGVGFENIDIAAATRAGVKVCNVQNYGNHAVSDHAITLMYACSRGLLTGWKSIRTTFGGAPFKQIMEFHERTVGIVGLGRIGGTLCGKVNHLFQEVVACDPYIEPERFAALGARSVGFEQLLEESDVISIHCNHTDETEGMFDAKAFSRMARCPVVVNTARGPIIDENALVDALDENRIHSAGIDVYSTELAAELPDSLLNHPRITATGHYAWYSARSHVELQKRAADNLLSMLQGGTPDDCLNPDVDREQPIE